MQCVSFLTIDLFKRKQKICSHRLGEVIQFLIQVVVYKLLQYTQTLQ